MLKTLNRKKKKTYNTEKFYDNICKCHTKCYDHFRCYEAHVNPK